MTLDSEQLRSLVKAALKEDIGPGDLTSLACLEPEPVTGKIVAKSDGVLSGTIPALLTFDIVDSANCLAFTVKDGDAFSTGDTIAEVEGFNQTVLASERVALNFLGRLSGIASLTSRFVKKINNPKCKLLDTRKTTPGWRQLEKAAVVHGGGHNHRHGLYDMILIKENHIASAGSICAAMKLAKEYLQTSDFRLQFDTSADKIRVEVEITNENELREAIECGVNRLLLDNQSVEELKTLVQLARRLNSSVQLEASGNVSLENIADIAATGVDFISVGAITHSATTSDFSLIVSS